MILDKIKALVKKAAPILIGVAFFYLLFWMMSPKPFSISESAKMQQSIIEEVRKSENSLRIEMQSRIDSVHKQQTILIHQNDSMIKIGIANDAKIAKYSNSIKSFQDEIKATFSNYRDSSYAAIIKRIQPK